jgi:hypothetical protein
MPEGPAVAPEDISNQMTAKFGGTMLPHYANAGTVKTCPPGYVFNVYINECVLPSYKSQKEEWKIPAAGYAKNNEFEWSNPVEDFVQGKLRPSGTSSKTPAPTPKKPSASDIKAQELFDKSFKITGGKTNYEKAQEEQARLIEEKRQKEGYYTKAKEYEALVKKQMSGDITSEEQKQAQALSEYFMGIKPGGEKTPERIAEDELVYNTDKKYGTLSTQQVETKKREEDAAKKKATEQDKAKNPYKYAIPGFGTKSDLEDYMNSGDFCENATCLVEDFNGKWLIINMG